MLKSPIKNWKTSEPNLHVFGFNIVIFQGVPSRKLSHIPVLVLLSLWFSFSPFGWEMFPRSVEDNHRFPPTLHSFHREMIQFDSFQMDANGLKPQSSWVCLKWTGFFPKKCYPLVNKHGNGTWTFWRCILFWKWGFSSQLVYRRVIYYPKKKHQLD